MEGTGPCLARREWETPTELVSPVFLFSTPFLFSFEDPLAAHRLHRNWSQSVEPVKQMLKITVTLQKLGIVNAIFRTKLRKTYRSFIGQMKSYFLLIVNLGGNFCVCFCSFTQNFVDLVHLQDLYACCVGFSADSKRMKRPISECISWKLHTCHCLWYLWDIYSGEKKMFYRKRMRCLKSLKKNMGK